MIIALAISAFFGGACGVLIIGIMPIHVSLLFYACGLIPGIVLARLTPGWKSAIQLPVAFTTGAGIGALAGWIFHPQLIISFYHRIDVIIWAAGLAALGGALFIIADALTLSTPKKKASKAELQSFKESLERVRLKQKRE